MKYFHKEHKIHKSKYAIGVDFGTLSGRVVVVDVGTGEILATSVHEYYDGVIDAYLPSTNIRLDPDWALQNPNDYIEVLKNSIPSVLNESNIDPSDVIGVGMGHLLAYCHRVPPL